MKLLIGTNLKQLRKEKDLTQEELAEILGVSYQSVSRWENNSCYPDMELLPTIAHFFATTVDRLLGITEAVEEEKVNVYLAQFQKAVSRGKIDECIRIAREAVAEYPNNYRLLNQLMYALFIAGDEDGNIPDWKENAQKYDAEITALGERIVKYCPDQNLRLEATARLAFNHCEMGRKEIGRKLYDTLPDMLSCKEEQMWWGLEEEEKLPFLRKKIRNSYQILNSALYALTDERLLPDQELLSVFEKEAALRELLYDGNYPNCTWESTHTPCERAKLYARLGQKKEMFKQLRIAAKNARAADQRPETITVTSLLLGSQSWNRTDFDTTDSRSICEILRDKWLASADFEPFRKTREFQEILEMLS